MSTGDHHCQCTGNGDSHNRLWATNRRATVHLQEIVGHVAQEAQQGKCMKEATLTPREWGIWLPCRHVASEERIPWHGWLGVCLNPQPSTTGACVDCHTGLRCRTPAIPANGDINAWGNNATGKHLRPFAPSRTGTKGGPGMTGHVMSPRWKTGVACYLRPGASSRGRSQSDLAERRESLK